MAARCAYDFVELACVDCEGDGGERRCELHEIVRSSEGRACWRRLIFLTDIFEGVSGLGRVPMNLARGAACFGRDEAI